MTLREWWITYQGYLEESWDHTSMITWGAKTAFGGRRVPRPAAFHPYRKTNEAQRTKITPGNFAQAAVPLLGI